MVAGNDDDSFSAWRHFILAEIKRCNDNIEKLADDGIEMRINIANLKLIAAIIGAAAGTAGATIGILILSL